MLASFLRFFQSDGRHFQIVSQTIFVCIGVLFLRWDYSFTAMLLTFGVALSTQLIGIYFLKLPMHSIKSALITAFGLTLLFKSNEPLLYALAAAIAIGQKFILKIRGQHLFNPANIGIIAVILFTQKAWISPAQWGNSTLIIFVIGTAGLAVLSRVKRIDTGLIFIATLFTLEYMRTMVYLGWNWEVLLHKLSSGSIWLFALFMITDPMTIPTNRLVRILWTMAVAFTSFYLTNFHFVTGAPLWALVCFTPLTPLLNKFFPSKTFNWIHSSQKQFNHDSKIAY